MIVDLLMHKRVHFSTYADVYRVDYRSFQRDLQQLRAIGREAGFTIAPIVDREAATLAFTDAKKRPLARDTRRIEALTTASARALGEPMTRELGTPSVSPAAPATTEGAADDGFYVFATPKLWDRVFPACSDPHPDRSICEHVGL